MTNDYDHLTKFFCHFNACVPGVKLVKQFVIIILMCIGDLYVADNVSHEDICSQEDCS